MTIIEKFWAFLLSTPRWLSDLFTPSESAKAAAANDPLHEDMGSICPGLCDD